MRDSDDPDLVNLLYAQVPVALLGGLGGCALLMVAIWGAIDHEVLTAWVVALIALTLVRIGLVRAYQHRAADPLKTRIWGRRYVYSALASGVLWGWAGVLLISTQRSELQVFTAFICGGMVAGAMATYAPNRAAFYAFALPTLLPLPPLFILEGSRLHWVMAVVTLIFMVLMVYSANRFHATLFRSLELARSTDALSKEMHHALTRLEESEARYRTLFELNPLMYFTLDASGIVQSVNELGASQLGYRVEELIDQPVMAVFPQSAHARVRAQLDRCLREPNRVHAWETEKVRKDGSPLWVRETAIAIRGQQGVPLILIICEDITEHKEVEGRIHQLAYFDPLTNLPNRRLFMDRLTHALAASKRTGEFAALMILDLDNFKTLNDTQGHDVGDRLLIEAAVRIKNGVHPDGSVGRLGGDEYVVLIENLGMDEAKAVTQAELLADQLLKALREPSAISAQGHTYSSTTSIGVTLFRGDVNPVDVLFKQADLALYRAKDAGRNTIRFFDPLMQAAIDERVVMESALRQGVERGELRLFLQPQVDPQGALRGAEALLRWIRPGLEPLTSSQFIPVAEETGLILPIGHWLLERACTQIKAWESSAESRGLQLTLNVSQRQFYQLNFVDQVRAALSAAGVEPTRLRLELTESLVLYHLEEIIERMQALKALGVSFSLGDFGTGFSSLSYLKRLPFDQIKIDQSFVQGIPHDPKDTAIVRAILTLTQSLGLQAVADGVETPAQRDFLFENGCTAFQGNLFGEPIPAEQWWSLLPAPEVLHAVERVGVA